MYDHYEVTREIIVELRKLQCDEVATKLEDDLSGFSGTEIFMALRSHLTDFLNVKNSCPNELEAKIRQLLKEISLALA